MAASPSFAPVRYSRANRTPDPPFAGNFVLKVDGIEIGAFTEVSGLSVQMDVEELAEGGQNEFVHRLPGRLKWSTIVLRRGVTQTDELFEWMTSCAQDALASGRRPTLRHGSVVVKSTKGERVREWSFDGAYPVRWSGPKLAATAKELASEELEVGHRGFRTTP